ncbi:MAG: GGDEF domain-containing protein [Nitrospirota bacterium]
MKSKLALAITLWGWLLFISWLAYDFVVYKNRWFTHIFDPGQQYEVYSFHVLIILVPFLYTFLGYLVNEREKLLEKIRESEARFRELSLQDDLTGLYNRRGFHFLAEQQIKVSNRTRQKMLLLYLDVDNVKWINDTLGHYEGDKALRDTAHILRKHIRQSDVIARVGGDEFVALVVKTSEDLPQVLTDRLEKSCESYNEGKMSRFPLTLSIGAADYDPQDPCSIDELLDRADRDMYEYKRKRKSAG